MKAAVVVFPGSNCDRDVFVSLKNSAKKNDSVVKVWHGDSKLPDVDLVVLPGGFSYGDYLRCGSIAANSPIMREVVNFANAGGHVLGICNGFQILTESGLLPGVLMRNKNLKFICKDVSLKVENTATAFTKKFNKKKTIRIPIAHAEGNYFAEKKVLDKLEKNGQVAFRYANESGKVAKEFNPNGATNNIAGIFNEKKNVLGMMPHPERLAEKLLGGVDGKLMFDSLAESF